MRFLVVAALVVATASWSAPADACMAFVPYQFKKKTEAVGKLEQGVMKVAVARHDRRTTLTLSNEVKGELRRFALMIPIPTKVKKKQVKVLKTGGLEELLAATAPEVSFSVDPDPCPKPASEAENKAADLLGALGSARSSSALEGAGSGMRASDYGVKVEQHIQVGGYDIAVLNAKDADGLARWLRKFKYDVPDDVQALMGDYLEHGWRFLVTRVNLKKLAKERFSSLRPLQIAFDSDELVLPIRLAAVSAKAPVHMAVVVLTKDGMATVKGRLVKRMPTDARVPAFVRGDLDEVHAAVVSQQSAGSKEAVLLEFAGELPKTKNVRETVVGSIGRGYRGGIGGLGGLGGNVAGPGGQYTRRPVSPVKIASLGAPWLAKGEPLFVTRYRVRVEGDPVEDLVFQGSRDKESFRVRYQATQPWQPPGASINLGGGLGHIGAGGQPPKVPDDLCEAGRDYLLTLGPRMDEEIDTIAKLTGWRVADVKRRVGSYVTLEPPPPPPPPPEPPPKAAKKKRPKPKPVTVAEAKSSSWRWGLGLLLGLAALVLFGRWQRGR
jgi:hypothetical protein